MARSLNSKYNFDNCCFACDIPEDSIFLVLKVKTKTGNYTLVEDPEKHTEKFRPWKKPIKDISPKRLPGVLSARKNNDNSMTSHSGPWLLSPAEMDYKPWFFDAPECLSSDKENPLPLESVTPSSLNNLSLEEGATGNENEAPTWEASVANVIMTTPRGNSPYSDQPGTLEQLEPKTDDKIIDITNYSERPANGKRSPQPNQKHGPNSMTQGPCPTPQTNPSYVAMNVATGLTKPHHVENLGNPPGEEKNTSWMASLFKEAATQGILSEQQHICGK